MIYIAWILTLVMAFGLGYFFRGLYSKIEVLEERVKLKVDKSVEPDAKSSLIDPLDVISEAQYHQEEMMKRLNQ